ncbi:MAG: tetratricopeptide repeat protein, partial [Verrucomicrobia bacterium]|nr:tetratricopeptide repeat protein [Verrucomicrobiota bacterium]
AEHHQVLADWLSDLDQHERALVEYRAVAALGSHDKAATHYALARTLYDLNRTDEARQELLYALEIAPRYLDALKLLTEISK